jgi:hypothetical protein
MALKELLYKSPKREPSKAEFKNAIRYLAKVSKDSIAEPLGIIHQTTSNENLAQFLEKTFTKLATRKNNAVNYFLDSTAVRFPETVDVLAQRTLNQKLSSSARDLAYSAIVRVSSHPELNDDPKYPREIKPYIIHPAAKSRADFWLPKFPPDAGQLGHNDCENILAYLKASMKGGTKRELRPKNHIPSPEELREDISLLWSAISRPTAPAPTSRNLLRRPSIQRLKQWWNKK